MSKRSRKYHKPPEKVQEIIAKALLPHLPHAEVPIAAQGTLGDHALVRSGLVDALCRLIYLGYSNFRAAGQLGVSHDMVDKLVAKPEFRDYYRQKLEIFTQTVGEEMKQLVLEVLGECIVGKVDDMRDKRTKPALRNQIRNELIELGRDLLKGRATGGADAALKAMYEKAIQRKQADGSTITETYRLTGPPVAAAPPGWPTEPAAGGEVAAPERGSGAASGSLGVGEAESGAGGAGSDGGDGEAGVRTEPGEPAAASEPATEGPEPEP